MVPIGANRLMDRDIPLNHLPTDRPLCNRFALCHRIGVGPLGAIFAAIDRDRDEPVTVKVLLPEVFKNEQAQACLIDVVERAIRLRHADIVRTIGLHRDGELRLVVTEPLEGVTLRQRLDALREGGELFPVGEALRVAVAICSALSYAHQHTVHGGVKPENIFLCDDGDVKLMDFGMTRVCEAGDHAVSGISETAVPFRAPEQLRQTKVIDHRTDQYATAAVTYEMITGHAPVGRVVSARERRPEIPRTVSRALDRALASDPDDRFVDMDGFATALNVGTPLRMRRAKLLAVTVAVLSVIIAGAIAVKWRAPIGLMIRKALRDPERQAAAESTRLQAMASASNWQRIAELLPDDAARNASSRASTFMAEGERQLKAMDYDEAAQTFQRALDLYEAQVNGAVQMLRDEPTKLAETTNALRSTLDALELTIYERRAESARRADACARSLRGARTDDERETAEVRLRTAETERDLLDRLLALSLANVFDASVHEEIAAKLDQADQLLASGAHRAALTTYAEIEAQLEELAAWPARAEEALHEESALLARIERFESLLGPVARESVDGQSAIENATAQAARGAELLADGRTVDAIALFQAAGRALSERRADIANTLLSRAREDDAGGRLTAAVLTLDELLALDPDHGEGQRLRTEVVSSRTTNSINMEFVFIPPGEFRMGSPSGEPGRDRDEHQTEVTIAAGFYLGAIEVTKAQWAAVMIDDAGDRDGDVLPVDRVTWHEAFAFCEKLATADGRRYRLPTEAEWEYACRAGTIGPFSFGEAITTSQANYDGDYAYGKGPKGVLRGKTVAVGSFPSNAWGLYAMHGNVWEWCSDGPEKGPDAEADGVPQESQVERHILRGGSWRHRPHQCRSANRVWGGADSKLDTIGFRVVLELE